MHEELIKQGWFLIFVYIQVVDHYPAMMDLYTLGSLKHWVHIARILYANTLLMKA